MAPHSDDDSQTETEGSKIIIIYSSAHPSHTPTALNVKNNLTTILQP